MSRRSIDIDTDLEVELPGLEEVTVLNVSGTVHSEYWADTGWECWIDDMRLTNEHGKKVSVECLDMHGANVWDEAEQVAMDAAR